MPKPKVLIFTDWFPPGYRAGGPIRSTANVVAALSADCDIRVVTSNRDFGCDVPYRDITPNTWAPYLESAEVIYLSPSEQTFERVGAILQTTAPDCVYLNSMFSPVFTLMPLWHVWRNRLQGRILIAPRGMLRASALGFKPWKKHCFLSILRAAGIGSWAWFHATDEQEKRDIQTRLSVPSDRIRFLPNLPEPPVKRVTPIEKHTGTAKVLYLSRIAPIKRLLHLLNALAKLPNTISVNLTVAGPIEDAAYWASCRSAIAALPPNVNVQCLDAVPHPEVRALIESHHFYVLPTLGENYGHAIVEALGAGRPVIISDTTPWRGLEAARAGWDVRADDIDKLRDAIMAAVQLDQAGYDLLSRGAWSFAKSRIADDSVIASYRQMLGPI